MMMTPQLQHQSPGNSGEPHAPRSWDGAYSLVLPGAEPTWCLYAGVTLAELHEGRAREQGQAHLEVKVPVPRALQA
jgi:hypothetical protein